MTVVNWPVDNCISRLLNVRDDPTCVRIDSNLFHYETEDQTRETSFRSRQRPP